MWYVHSDKGTYTSNVSTKTLKKLVKNCYKFKINNGNVVYSLDEKTWVPYIPVSQQAKTILCYHCDLGHTRTRNLVTFLQNRILWP